MIGNDIVDLKQAAKDSNWQRPRFLDKVFTTKEQQLIFSAKNQHQLVWLLWSMKEAAYKLNVQQFGKRFFNPKKMICNTLSETSGIVKIGNVSYFTTSIITEDYIYTIATLEVVKDYKSKCFKVENSAYKFQSEVLKNRFFEAFPIKDSSLEIRKNEVGVPKLFQDDKLLDYSFSLTHHGRFCGWVY